MLANHWLVKVLLFIGVMFTLEVSTLAGISELGFIKLPLLLFAAFYALRFSAYLHQGRSSKKKGHVALNNKQLYELQYAIDQASIVAITDPRGRITYVNSKFCSLSKYAEQELIGQDHRIINSGHHPKEMFQELWATISKGEVWKGEIKNKAKDGSYYWVDTTIIPFMDKNGRPEHYYSIRTDITERVLAQELVEEEREAKIHMQKLESLGTLAGGVAHDFNNILQGLSMGLEHVSKTTRDENIIESIDDLSNLTIRGKELVRQILAFSRKKPEKLKPLSLKGILQELNSMMTSTLPAQVNLHLAPISKEPIVLAESTQLLQVFINLCINSAYALRETGGNIFIELDVSCRARSPRLRHEEGEYVRIRIRDDGQGVPADLHARIFEPFFTTKPVGEGTGMGLSVVHGILISHGGDIILQPNQPGVGAVFDIFLPVQPNCVVEQQESPPTHGEARNHPLQDQKKILLVDDDLMIERFGKNLLLDLGYGVTTASSGQQALDTMKSNKDTYDLVITDLTMPNMDGIELCKALKPLTDVPILLATGNLDKGPKASEFSDLGIQAVLEKPYSTQELKNKLQDIFDSVERKKGQK